MFKLVIFSNKIISNTCTVVFNVPKVHAIRCLKVLGISAIAYFHHIMVYSSFHSLLALLKSLLECVISFINDQYVVVFFE